MKIKVISLERSQERRDTFKRANPHLVYEYFNAIDGRSYTKEQIAETKLFREGVEYSPGAIGCALSHHTLWTETLRAGEPLTIVEDDAVFRRDFNQIYANTIANAPQDWDMIVWAWNFDSVLAVNVLPNISPVVMAFDQEEMRKSIPKFQDMKQPTTLLRLNKCFGTPAYTISVKGAKKFRAMCFPITKFAVSIPIVKKAVPNGGVDVAMNRAYSMTNSYVCFPPAAVTANDINISTVQQVFKLSTDTSKDDK